MVFTIIARGSVVPTSAFADGSAQAPSIAFQSIPSTGLFNASGNLGVAVAGTEVARVTGSGVVVSGALTAQTSQYTVALQSNAHQAMAVQAASAQFNTLSTATLSASSLTASSVTANTLTANGSFVPILVANTEVAQITSTGLSVASLSVSNAAVLGGLTTLTRSALVTGTKTNSSGTVTHDLSAATTWIHAAPQSGITANFVNVPSAENYQQTVRLVFQQGATPYGLTGVQIEGVTQTLNWLGGVATTYQSYGVDSVDLTLIRTSGTWLVLAAIQNYGQTATAQKVVSSDLASGDSFGYKTVFSGDGSRCVITAPGKVSNTGAAYVFVRTGTTYVQEQKLLAGDAATGDLFGIYALGMTDDGTRVVIGAHGKLTNTGAVYVFLRSPTNVWSQEQKLTASDATTNAYFGYSAGISRDGTRLVVGAYGMATNTGAAYVFARSGVTWSQEQKITAGDAATGDAFGQSAAISNDGSRVLVGAWGKASNTGAAYVFLRSGTTWSQEAKLTASDAATGDQFSAYACSLSSDASRAIVGALSKTGGGAAYVFSRSATTWTQEAKLTAFDAATGDQFGTGVTMTFDGTKVIVGANNKANGSLTSAGAAYIYYRSGSVWALEQKLLPSDLAASDAFGFGLAITNDGTRVAIGSYGKTGGGAAYIFTGYQRIQNIWVTS